MSTTRQKINLDRKIDTYYYKHAQGRAIDVLDIAKIYKAGHTSHAEGKDVEQAIIAAIGHYTVLANKTRLPGE